MTYSLVTNANELHVRAECDAPGCPWYSAWWMPGQTNGARREAERHLKIKHKEKTMRTIRELDDAIELTVARLARLEEERAALTRLPEEPSEGTTIRFDVTFAHGGRRYTYVAVRIGPHWYTTATEDSRKTWHELLTLMCEDVHVRDGERISFTVMMPAHTIRAKK